MFRRRGKQIYGEFEDTGRYYHCRNCGFVCDTKRDSIVDFKAEYEEPILSYLLLETGIDFLLTEDGGRIIFEDPTGKPAVVGCPFCGIANYK